MHRVQLAGLGLAAALLLPGCPEWKRTSPGCAPGASGPRAYDALAYDLAARFEWATRTLLATERITLAVCPGGDARIELDANVLVTRVSLGGADLPFELDLDAETLSVRLPASAPGGGPLTFSVEYSAPPGLARGIVSGTSSADDPVRSRVVHTDSEPRDGHTWLVEKDDPSDRALFSVTLDLAPGEDAVANGERVLDAPLAGGGRRVGHALDVPIPTYLMAFAAGELEHVERPYVSAAMPGEHFPLALWYRRGLPVDATAHLDLVEDAMTSLEQRLGRYPFSRYAVVLLPPPFGGGMENATITFNSERSGVGAVSFGLNAHELAHQWLGDWVTMATYDDVWVKEGMATLLASDAQRGVRDLGGTGRLFGGDQFFDPDDAVVDPELSGIRKYTSGPYTRAASLLTQVRALVGEEAFWSSVRAFLSVHARGSATGEEFVRSFSPHLDERWVDRVLAQLPRKGWAAFDLEVTNPDPLELTFSLSDPGRHLLMPFEITTRGSSGAAEVRALTPGVPLRVQVPAGGYAAVDERDLQSFTAWRDTAGYRGCPTSPTALDAFASRSPRNQEDRAETCAAASPAAFLALEASLDSVDARRQLYPLACSIAGASTGAERAAWFALLEGRLGSPPRLQFDRVLGLCPPPPGFEAELVALAASAEPHELARLEYLLSFFGSAGYGPDGQAALRTLATSAPTLKLRSLARSLGGAGARAAAPDDLRAEDCKAGKRREGLAE